MKYLYAFLFILFFGNIFCQPINAWTESFGSGCSQLQVANGYNPSGNGVWTVSYLAGYSVTPGSDEFYISSTENGMGQGFCSNGCLSSSTLNNRTLHIGTAPNSTMVICPTGDCGAKYNTAKVSNLRAESPVLNCASIVNYNLTFDYLCYGELNDNAYVYYSINGGTTWTVLMPIPKSYCFNGSCTSSLSCSAGGVAQWLTTGATVPTNSSPTVKIGFGWVNNGDNIGSNPSLAIDNILLSLPLGVNGVDQQTSFFDVFPNPVSDKLTIKISGKQKEAVVELLDIYGRQLIFKEVNFYEKNNCEFFIGELQPGVYFVKITSENHISQQVKIVKE